MNAFIGGSAKAFLAGRPARRAHGSIPETVFSMFQLTFAIITPALIIGAFAERVRFAPCCCSWRSGRSLVYVPVAHWVWGGGWLQRMGALDFAGGIVVHVTAGVAGLVTAIYVGKRKGYPTRPMPPHSLTLSVVGAGMLWVGWFGFNAGSALGRQRPGGDGAGRHPGLRRDRGAWSGSSSSGTATAGPACSASSPAPWPDSPPSRRLRLRGRRRRAGHRPGGRGVVCFFGATTLKRRLGYDDSLDAFGVHGVGGLVGSILTGAFAATQLGRQRAGLRVAPARRPGDRLRRHRRLVCGMTWVCIKIADLAFSVRVDDEQEIAGLDLTAHEERGYDY